AVFLLLEQAFIVIFATPDFGAGAATIGCFLLIVWAIVLVFFLVAVARGIMLLKNNSTKSRVYGVLLILVSGIVPLSCCLGPPHVVRLCYGHYPLGSYPSDKVKEGMTTDEVLAALGPPHERDKNADGERWYYWIDSFGMYWFAVA